MLRPLITVLFALFLLLWLPLCGVCAEKPLKIGFVYVSPPTEAGWSHAHDVARKALESIPGVSTSFVASVPEGADSERVIERLAEDGHDIIFTTSFGYMDATLKAAARYPKTQFLHCSGYKTAPNVSVYFGRMYQARYLTGMVAGAMTDTDVIGYVAAHPIPEVIRGINAFTLGARSVNPKAEVRVFWTRTWYDLVAEKEAGRRLADAGADVIAQHQDSPGPQEAAEEKGVFSIGYNMDMSAFAPKAHLVAAVWDWAPFYKSVVEGIRSGTWTSGAYWPGLESGIVDIAAFSGSVPPGIKDAVLRCKSAMISGDFAVFTGPLKDRDGKMRIGPKSRASDSELLVMDWFVAGVVDVPDQVR